MDRGSFKDCWSPEVVLKTDGLWPLNSLTMLNAEAAGFGKKKKILAAFLLILRLKASGLVVKTYSLTGLGVGLVWDLSKE